MLLGGDTFSVHTIHEVRLEEQDLPLYTIEYRGEGAEIYSFDVYLSQESGGTLRFPNQMEMKWQRDPNARMPWGVLTAPATESVAAPEP